jgi:hypothetical protein
LKASNRKILSSTPPNKYASSIVRLPRAHRSRKPHVSAVEHIQILRQLDVWCSASTEPQHRTRHSPQGLPQLQAANTEDLTKSELDSTKQPTPLPQLPFPPRQLLLLHHRRWRPRHLILILIPSILHIHPHPPSTTRP